jgi:GPH family glycoside/pentoside/hexuronide:cation symporter
VLAWTRAAHRTSKSAVLQTGLVINILAYLAFYFLRVETLPPFLALAALAGVGTAATVVAFWAMLPDTVEYGELKSGTRDEGMIFGLYQFAQKAASGLGVGLVGFILAAVDYQANTVQDAAVLDGIARMNFLIPTLSAAVTFGIVCFYPLRGRRHDRILEDLKRREAQP